MGTADPDHVNTEGHHGVAEEAGIPLLQDAFGKDERSIQAFYLGNWLTDVSQLVDPVAYSAAAGKAKSAVDAIVGDAARALQEEIDRITATLYEELASQTGTTAAERITSLKPDLLPYVEEGKQAISNAMEAFLASRTDERGVHLAVFMRNVFLVTGYFRFVHPKDPGEKPQMDFESFMRVFGRPTDTRGAMDAEPANDRPGAYTQYYPHEHLDRPEILPSQDPPVFAPGPQLPGRPFRVAPGAPAAGPRSPRQRERLDPDLYSYLRDDVECTAGLLAEVDLEFQQAIARGISDTDPGWHLTLAKLGHALHQVEDFFAHSNWIELAVRRLGPDVLAKLLPPKVGPDLLLPAFTINRAHTVFTRRLTRHVTDPAARRKPEPEDWVVTGFFDLRDTVVSVLHVLEEAFGFKVPDPWARGTELYRGARDLVERPRTTEHKARKLLRDTLDLLTDPERAFDDRDNDVAKSLKSAYEDDITKLRRPGVSRQIAEQLIRESELLRNAPPEIGQAFLVAIVEGSRIYTIHNTAISLYGALRIIGVFLSDPIAWLLDFLPGWLKGKVIDAAKYYGKELFYDGIAASRIGCHSLLAKDHGLEPFYGPQRDCATAVHWYIVKTLLRWADEKATTGYVDWLQLLEYFLRNPLPPKPGSIGTTRVPVGVTLLHVTAAGDQLDTTDPARSLTKRYRRTALRPREFSWRAIADANFRTGELPRRRAQDVVNQTLRDKAWGYPVTPPNYAFRPGVRLLIPGQKAVLVLLSAPQDDPTWFRAVIDKGWQVFTGYEDPERGQSVPPLQHHTPISISRGQLDQIITRGRMLRRQARQAYRPTEE